MLASGVVWLGALLVFGTYGVILVNLVAQGDQLHLGFQQMIHARIPWLLLGLLWTGGALGIAAAARKRTLPRLALAALELPLVALVSWYVFAVSFLPPHTLAVAVGDPFPAFSLVDQEGVLHEVSAGRASSPALYIFYRGDW